MSSPPLRGTAEWSATREVALLLGLTGGNRYAAQQLWLRKERIKAEASQVASAGPPQASQQPAGYRAKPAPAQAQAVPKQRTPAQLARNERSRERLFQKHLAKVAKVHPMLQAWLRRARASLGQPMELQPVPPATPTRPSVAVPESGAGQPPFQAEVVNLPCLAGTQSDLLSARLLSITAMAAYQDKSFEELRWEHYSKGNVLEARPPAEPPAAAQPAPPSQQPSTALVAAARASLDASDLQDDRGSKRDALARTPPLPPPPSALPPPLTHARGLRPAGVRASRLHSPAQPPRLSRRCSLSPPTTTPPPPSPPPPTPIPPPPEAPAPGTLPPTPSAARRSVLALPAAPTGDPPAGARLALPAADTVPTLPQTHTLPRFPAPSHPLNTTPQPCVHALWADSWCTMSPGVVRRAARRSEMQIMFAVREGSRSL